MFVGSQTLCVSQTFYNKMRSKFTDCNYDYQAKSLDSFNFLIENPDRRVMLKYLIVNIWEEPTGKMF